MQSEIIGISVDSAKTQSLIEALESNLIDVKDVIIRFDRTAFLFRSAALAITAQMHASDLEADPKSLTLDEIREIKKAAAPKKAAYQPRTAQAARERYDSIHAKAVIEDPCSKRSHKGWVTRGEYAWRVEKGLFTHEYVIVYNFHGNRHVEASPAPYVSLKQARSAMYRKKRALTKAFLGCEVVSAQVVPYKKKAEAA